MTREELLNKAIYWFRVITEDISRITSGNLPHNAATTKGRALRAYEFIEKHKNECFDEWHKESEESIYDSIMDWGRHTFVCLMRDGTIQLFFGNRVESCDGTSALDIYNADDYNTDDIIIWIEIPKIYDENKTY